MKNIIITGGHTGIGLELTKRLVKDGHRVGLIVRKADRASGIAGISDVFVADLSDQSQVRSVANKIVSQWVAVDMLFNNAGVLLDAVYQSPQNNEMHFEVNTLSPYLLTTLLKPALDSAESPVIVNTVTDGLNRQNNLLLDELIAPTKFRKLLGSYLQSKLALTLLMTDLADSWANVRIANVTPGPNKTNMTAGPGMPALLRPLRAFMFAPPHKGAGLLHDAAFETHKKYASGSYISKGRAYPLKFKLGADEKNRLLKYIDSGEPA